MMCYNTIITNGETRKNKKERGKGNGNKKLDCTENQNQED